MQARFLGLFATGVFLTLARPALADDAAAKAAIEKGLKALGGAENVAKFKGATVKMKGTFHGMGMAVPYTGTWTIMPPDRMRFTIISEAGGQQVAFTRVFNRDKGWTSLAGMTTEMSKEEIADMRHELYAFRVQLLLPLVKEPGFTLSSLGDMEVDKKPAVGVRITHKGQRDLNLYLDKASGLPVRLERPVRDEATGQEIIQEEIYGDYKEIEGVQQSMKMLIKREGKIYVDGQATEFKVEKSLDDSQFGKP